MTKSIRRTGKQIAFAIAIIIGATVSMASIATIAAAQDIKNYSRATLQEWLDKYSGAKPDFKPGDVLTQKDLERMRPFLPPGYLEQLNFPEMKAEIIATRDHTPRKDFMECSEKYQPQVKINPDGTLANYLCGEPFSDDALNPSDPLSGLKSAYNFDYRWQNYGEFSLNFMFIYDRFGEKRGSEPIIVEPPLEDWIAGVPYTSKLPSDVTRDYRGGGNFQRTAGSFYQRLYLTHLAPLASSGGVLNVPDAKNFFWKEFEGFISPFDVRGEVIINYRYSDPKRADDAWVYDPKLRRVRRISVEVKSDSVAGTEQTVDDFYTFSGRVLAWNWKFLGWKDLLCVFDAKDDYPHFNGPNGQVPDDVWSIRRFAVVERSPKAPNHPYSSVVMFWDAQNWFPWLAFAFTRDKKLYKTWGLQHKWSEDFKEFAEFNHGVHDSTLQSEVVVDVQRERATIFAGYGTGNPNVTIEQAKRVFDINKLEEAHR
ncbi:MAG TPA: DUF1329 domain-containing protein [Candidatus Binataceae bacterium]|nr:DUF1329 domain-containing protein [Candidatus Binataceae bacterium]